MTIENDLVVAIDYKLTNDAGELLDTSEGAGPLTYLHGHKNIIPGLENALVGKKEGDQLTASIPAAEAYGEKREDLVSEVPLSELAGIPDLKAGLQLQADTPQGVQVFTVLNVGEETATLDGNHPLAGLTLHFDVTVKTVRKANAEEISHGHVHGEGGHHH